MLLGGAASSRVLCQGDLIKATFVLRSIVHCRNKMSVKFILVLAVCLAFMSIGYTNVAAANPSNSSEASNNTAVRFAQTGGVVSLVLLPIALHP